MYGEDSRRVDIALLLSLVAISITYLDLKNWFQSAFGTGGTIIILLGTICIVFWIYANSVPAHNIVSRPHKFHWRSEAERRNPNIIEKRFYSNRWWNEPFRWLASIIRYYLPFRIG